MAIDRFDYLPSIDRPVIRWPNGARLAFWIAPNIGHYEYLPLPDKVRNYWPRMAHPDTKFYAHHDYGNRVGFWRLAEVFEQHSRDSLSLFARADLVDSALMTLPPCDLRIGVLRRTFTDRAELESVMPQYEAALSKLARAGATLIDPCDLPSADALQAVRSSVFRTEFKAALDDFLTDHGAPCGIASLDDLIAWNEKHPEAVPYGQGLLLAAQATAGFDDPQYRLDRARDLALSRAGGIEAALSLGVQVLIAPMGTAAKCSGKAGSPVLAIPVGLDPAGLPFGVTLLAAPGQDALLLAVGAAVGSVIGDRRVPQLHDSGAASRFRR